MALPTNITQREREKFRETANGLALAVVGDDGSAIGGGSATVYQGTSVWEVGTSSLPTISIGNTINSLIYDAAGNSRGANVDSNNRLLVKVDNETSGSVVGRVYIVDPTNSNRVDINASGQMQMDLAAFSASLPAGSDFIGLVSTASIHATAELVDSGGFIGLVSTASIHATAGLAAGSNVVGIVRLQDATGDEISVAAFPSADNAAVQNTIATSAFPLMFDGSAWDRVRGDSTNGLLVNLGSNNDVTIQSGATVILGDTITIGNAMVTVTLGTALDSGNDSVSIGSNVTLNPSPNFIGLVSTASIQGKVNITDESTGATMDVLSDTASDGENTTANPLLAAAYSYMFNGTGWDRIRGDTTDGLLVNLGANNDVDVAQKTTGVGKTLNVSPIALAASNLSGATIFVASASSTFYITNLILSTTSNVGVNFISNGTYLTGNASVRMQLAPQSRIIENGDVEAPLYFGLTTQTNFLIVTDTAAPISGRVTWYEE